MGEGLKLARELLEALRELVAELRLHRAERDRVG
jgi:hypothetical protein